MIKIIADSTCDLSDELIKKYDIDLLPLYIHMGDKEYKDKLEITPQEIYRWSDENRTTPKTAAPSIEDAMNIIEKYQKQVFFLLFYPLHILPLKNLEFYL